MEFLFRQSEWTIFVALLIAMFLALEVGWRIGSRGRRSGDEGGRSQVSAIQAAVLGLLALLLGFTFSMAGQRFEARRTLILQEANEIGTAYLRTDLAEEPERSVLRDALRQYVDVRVAFYESREEDSRRFERDSERLHSRLWETTVVAAEKNPTPVRALLVASINAVIDIHSDRIAALQNHVPPVILWMLFVVGALGAGMTGYASAFEDPRYWVPTTTMLLLISSVILVIVDLDRPRVGLVRAGQGSMLDLQRMLREDAAH